MNNSNLSKTKLAAGIGICFLLGLLTFMSILGENHKSVNLVENYFDELKNNNYRGPEKSFYKNPNDIAISSKELQKSNFILELALLEYYGMSESSSYELITKRENFWFPLFTEPKISYKIKLISKQTSQKTINNSTYIDNLFVLVRDNGHWKIDGINIKNSAIQNIYEKYKSKIELDQYVSFNDKIITFSSNNIDLSKLEGADKRVLIYNLETVVNEIKN